MFFFIEKIFNHTYLIPHSYNMLTVSQDDEKQEFVDVLRQAPFSLVSAFICFMSIWSVIGLAGFHTYLTTTDQTTNEDVRSSPY